jgi:hypothetical protein
MRIDRWKLLLIPNERKEEKHSGDVVQSLQKQYSGFLSGVTIVGIPCT